MASGLKLSPVSGVKAITAAGTAERLVAASAVNTRLVLVTFGANGDDGAIIGDSGVVYADGNTRNGIIVSDALTGSAAASHATIDLLSSWNGKTGVHGIPYVDLYDLWGDVAVSGSLVERYSWFLLTADGDKH